MRNSRQKLGNHGRTSYIVMLPSKASEIFSIPNSKQSKHTSTKRSTDVRINVSPSIVVVATVVRVVAGIVHELSCWNIKCVVAKLFVQSNSILGMLHCIISIRTPIKFYFAEINFGENRVVVRQKGTGAP